MTRGLLGLLGRQGLRDLVDQQVHLVRLALLGQLGLRGLLDQQDLPGQLGHLAQAVYM